MIDNSIIQATNSWPFVEARKLVKERQKIYEKKGKITLQTGYGPSGLPHIGTFAEVARTTMMVNAIKQIIDIPTEIITFSDDMDGLRKVPDNIPDKEILEKNLHKPLTSIPDPFKKFKSFGEHNNEMLKKFLDKFKFNYIFRSSTDTYKKGIFNNTLFLILEKYDQIMEIILPTLGKERQKTYSPFLPICPETGQVLEVPIIEIKKKEGKIIYKNGSKKIETEVTNGKCKLQWKVDWAMRWYAFDVDYEMYGKDLIESAILSSKICQTLGKKSPNGFAYELFLDEKGEKISKSKGNGITIEQWLKYASPESLSFYMFQKPKSAKTIKDKIAFTETSVSNKSPFLNEQLVYTFKLFRRAEARNINLNMPHDETFFRKETAGKPKRYSQVINGISYDVEEISTALFPLKVGKAALPPSMLELDLILPVQGNRTNDPFARFFNDPFFGISSQII